MGRLVWRLAYRSAEVAEPEYLSVRQVQGQVPGGVVHVLLEEALALRGSLDIETVNEVTQATLIAARMGDWPLTLRLADRSIRHLQWGGQRSWLAGILNVVARAITDRDSEAAARLQGAARHLAVQLGTARPTAPADASVASPSALPAGSSVITELRRQTSTLLRGVFDEELLRQFRAEGEAMGSDEAATYALDAIARVDQGNAQR
jgi:hypothetical protein